jgi:hypothetical protein
VHAIAKFAATAKLDWAGLAIALVVLALVYFAGMTIDGATVLVTNLLCALGRGALLTAKRKAEQAALLEVAAGVKAIDVTPLKVFVDDGVAEAIVVGPDDDTAPIDVSSTEVKP